MGQLIKYEFRNSRKPVLNLVFIIGIASLVLQVIFNGLVRVEIADIDLNGPYSLIVSISTFIAAGGGLLIFGTFIAYYLQLANILKTDIYHERGYITFSLPRSGYQILGAKLIVALFWSIILPIVVFLWNALIGFVLWVLIPGLAPAQEVLNAFSEIFNYMKEVISDLDIKLILSSIFNMFTSSVFSLLVMFSAVIVDYKIGKRKRDGSRWIVFALLFLVAWAIFTSQVLGLDSSIARAEYTYLDDNSIRNALNSLSKVYFINAILELAASVMMFIFVGHNLENKIEK